MKDLTALLNRAARGDKDAEAAAWSYVYDELRRVAQAHLRRLSPGETLSTTALVHEAYLKLMHGTARPWEERRHFYVVASKAMRHILINYAEKQRAQKRGGSRQPISLEAMPVEPATVRAEHLLEIDAALARLARENPRLGRVVELRFFGGLTNEEVAGVLDVSKRTAWRDWAKAKRWLAAALAESDPVADDEA